MESGSYFRMLSFTASTQGNKDASQAIVMSVTFSAMFSSVQLAEGPDGLERAQRRCKPDGKLLTKTFSVRLTNQDVDVVVQSYWKNRRN